MGGIGIRVGDLEQTIADTLAIQRRLVDESQQARLALAGVRMAMPGPAGVDAEAERLRVLSSRLAILLDEMRGIAWNGPSTPLDFALVDPRDLRPGWAVDQLQANLARLDNAAKGGGRDGKVSTDDLLAALKSTDDPALASAIIRVLSDPVLFEMLDTGGGDSDADGSFSDKDIGRIKKGVDGIALDDGVHALEKLEAQLATFDTAAHGGKADGRFSKNDLRAIVAHPGSYSADVVEAARVVLDHDGLLAFINEYKERKANLGIRLAKGIAVASWRLDGLVNPVHAAFDFVVDPKEAIRRRASFTKGALSATWGIGKSLWELSKLQPQYFLVDPKGTIEEYRKWGKAINYMRKHPGKLAEALTDIDTLEKDPDRWLGKLMPDVIITILTAGEGAAARGSRIMVAVEDLDDISRLSRVERALMKGRGVAQTLTDDLARTFDEDLTKRLTEKLAKIDRLAAADEVETATQKALFDSLSEMVKENPLRPLKNSSTFYSATYPGGEGAWEVARRIAADLERGTLDQAGSGTPLGEWLSELGQGRVPSGAGRDVEEALAAFKNAKNPVWSEVSAAYAQATRGRVVAATKMSQIGRVFVDDELPALIKNPKVTKIFTDLNPEMRAVVLERLSNDAIKVIELRRLLRNGTLTQIDDFVDAIASEKPK